LAVPAPRHAALRAAPTVWWDNARLTLDYARHNHAHHGRLAQCVGLLAQAACQAAHAVLAARGVWVTNEKTLLTLAGLPEIDGVVADARPAHLVDMVDAAHQLMSDAVASARGLR
jgi:hypothetical protein